MTAVEAELLGFMITYLIINVNNIPINGKK